jgi:2-keto-4-pentenoate hydratase/2-oxohepta-3-ene-1,7-dioic acid hydratase in catechol pathway
VCLKEFPVRLVRYNHNGRIAAGLMKANSERILPLDGLGSHTPLEFLQRGANAWQKAAKALAETGDSMTIPMSAVKLLAPLPDPGKLICVGLNYRDHAIESNMQIPTQPTVFCKFNNAICGPDDTVEVPPITVKPDYEAEFAFVIGTGGKKIAAADWKEHVFGYTILNDVSARDIQLATPQWILGKSLDTFGPMGPWIVTADEIADPHELQVKMTINGEVLQNSNTRELIFKIPELIEHISSITPLQPGDIISTGTPAGVGMGHTPPRWLRDGDTMVIEVTGIGTLTNPVKFVS